MHEQNGYLTLEHLSDIEFYYSIPSLINDDRIILEGEEFHHSVNVMRNSVGEIIFITDGLGQLYKSKIVEISKKKLIAEIIETIHQQSKAENIFFCLPILKNTDRIKFAIEKCVELGIINFILFTSSRTIPQKIKLDKFQKTALAAMKQSLRTFLPEIRSATFNDITKIEANKIIFDQHSKNLFDGKSESTKSTYLLFGPEGGFNESELNSISEENRYCLSSHRLRSETAILKCASLLKSI